MTPFELHEPQTLREAIELLDPDDPTVRPIAGGTALMLMMKAGVFRPTKLVSLRDVKDTEHDRASRGRRAQDRRHDAARGAGAFGGRAQARAGHHAHAAHAVECARAQCRDRRRRIWRTPIRTWTCRRC